APTVRISDHAPALSMAKNLNKKLARHVFSLLTSRSGGIMIRAIACLTLAGLLSTAAFAQSTGAAAFDVADVHVSAKTANPNMNRGALRGGRYSVQRATMLDLI